MNRNAIITLAKKEFFSFINSPASFLIIIPFIFLTIFIFLRTTLTIGEASMRSYFDLLPWFATLFVPAITMKLISDEYKLKTLELLLSHPISELDIIIGKFIGTFAFYLFVLLWTVGLPISLLIFANPDPGILLTQYFGAVISGAFFISIGIFCSALTKNSIGSFLLGASIIFGLILINLDFIALLIPVPVNILFQEIALLPRIESSARGLIDVRDFVYFAVGVGFFILLSAFKLSQAKIIEDKSEKMKRYLGMGLILSIGIAVNIYLSFFPLKIDLTQNKLFTLSEGTVQTLRSLPDIVTINIYTSDNLPGELYSLKKELLDTIRDYKKITGKLIVNTYPPDRNIQYAQEARQAGIEEVTFNKIGAGKFEVQNGFLGLAIRYADKADTIPFLQGTEDLEFQLTSKIRKIVSENEKIIGLYDNTQTNNQLLEQIIKSQYETSKLLESDLQKEDKLKDMSALIIIDDGTRESSSSPAFRKYFENGGKILILANGVSVNPQLLFASKSKSKVTDFLADYGVKINNDLIYDVELNETLSFGKGNVRYLAPYPFWLKALPEDESFPAISAIKSLTLPWTSSLTANPTSDVVIKKILTSGKSAGKQEENFDIAPENSTLLTKGQGEKILLALQLQKGEGRTVVIGNANFILDEFLPNFQENIAFLGNTIDYLASDKDIASIRRKTGAKALFTFQSPLEVYLYQWGNVIIPPVVLIILALSWFRRRKIHTSKNIYDWQKN